MTTDDTPTGPSGLLTNTVDVARIGDDEEQLVALNEFFNSPTIKSELHWFTHRDTLKRAARRDDRRLYYIKHDGGIRGGLMIWCESRVLDPEQAQIRLVAVDPDYRECGLGRRLVDAGIQFAEEWSKDTIIADVAAHSPAVWFWRACGFADIDWYSTDGGRLMYRMERPLTG